MRSVIDLQLPLVPDGIPDEMVPTFTNVYNALRNLQQAIGDLTGANFQDPQYLIDNALGAGQTYQIANMKILRIPVAGAISKGQLVNLFDSGGGVVQARFATAVAGGPKRCHGIAMNTTVNAGDLGIIACHDAYNNNFVGLTPMAIYYLSAVTPGGITSVAPVAAGTITQEIGFALSATELIFHIGTPVQN